MNRSFILSVFLPGFFTLASCALVDISPGVARISLIEGHVSAQRADTGDWPAAALNQPLAGGDRVSTGDRSKAELRLDHANVLRLGNNAQAKIATLDGARIQVQIGHGLAYYTVFKDSEHEVEIDTPNAAIRPRSEGIYRIEVNGFDTQVIVRAGAVDISTPQGGGSRVETGEAATVRGTANVAGYVLGGAPSRDVWDSWNSERDGMKEDGARSQPGRGPGISPSSGIPRVVTSNTTRRMPTLERVSLVATEHVASRSSGGSHPAMLSRVPTSTSTRRMTLTPGSRGTMARSAQRYLDSANRQMDKGNYTAAIAIYKAWQVDGNSAVVKARLGRARRAMQAENQIIASRR